jgi:uncharacterized protein
MSEYRKSRFTVSLPVKRNDGEFIAAYNTLTEALMLIPEAKEGNFLEMFSSADSETMEKLIRQGIFVRNGIDETAVFKEWKQRHVHDFSMIRSKVLVTRRCNNRCAYCILDPEAKDMSLKTACDMDEFYIRQMINNPVRQVRDDYIGGEPLMNLKVILKSASRRFYFCKGRGIDYGFIITTNGTLITPEIINKLKAVGLMAVRVSLAGPADVHDRLRPSKKGGKTFEKIMKNLEKISELITVNIECQYDAGTRDFERIPAMLDEINRRNIRVGNIAFTPILEKRGENGFCAGMGDVKIFLFLKGKAAQIGFAADRTTPSNACMADFRSNFVFDTDGTIIPCPSLQNGELVYGHVVSGIDFVAESQLLNRKLPDQCSNQCELLPICMGGCRLQALTRNNDFSGIDCHYDMYRRLLENYVTSRVLKF